MGRVRTRRPPSVGLASLFGLLRHDPDQSNLAKKVIFGSHTSVRDASLTSDILGFSKGTCELDRQLTGLRCNGYGRVRTAKDIAAEITPRTTLKESQRRERLPVSHHYQVLQKPSPDHRVMRSRVAG